MRSIIRPIIAFVILAAGSFAFPAISGLAGEFDVPLVLEATIPLPGVRGRIDHMAADLKHKRVIVAELGNNTADVVDISTLHVIHRITGLSEPQGIGYSEQTDLIFIANGGDGSVRLLMGENFVPAGRIELGDDADNVRIDPHTGLVVVGFGSGGLALINPVDRAKVAEIPLSAHPEGFQIGPRADRAFVNVPNAAQIAVVDLNARRVVGTWRTHGLSSNFPMALQLASGLIAVVFRHPPVVALLDQTSGAIRDRTSVCGDADDVFFDERHHRIYVSCGAGIIAAFQMEGDHLRPLRSIGTAPGARTSLFVPGLNRLFVARPASRTNGGAAVLVYRPVP